MITLVSLAGQDATPDKTCSDVISCTKTIEKYTDCLLIAYFARNEKGSHRCKPLVSLVGRAGIEPATNGLRARTIV